MRKLGHFSVLLTLALLFGCVNVLADALDHWHWRNPFPVGNSLNGITFAANRFVAVGNAGSVLSSTNGVDWVASNPLTANRLNAVTYGNGLFVAVGGNGALQTSPDGTNWISLTSGTSTALAAIAYGGGVFVAVGTGGTILVSTNAMNWTAGISGVTNDIIGLSWGNGAFVGICFDGTTLRSLDGTTWTKQALINHSGGFDPDLESMVFANGSFWVLSFQAIQFSPPMQYKVARFFSSADGISWNTNTFSPSSYGGYPFITYGNGVYFVGGTSPLISTDGQTWSIPVMSGYTSGNACTYGNGAFVMVGGNGAILSSTNGLDWTNRTASSYSTLTSIANGNGVSVAVGGYYTIPVNYFPLPYPSVAGVILRSTNGLSYAPQITPFTNYSLTRVVFNAGTFTAIGTNGIVIQSSDGITWTQRNSGTLYPLRGIAAGSSLLVTVGDTGVIQTSPAGLAWTGRFSGTSENLYSVVYGNGMFVSVGYQGIILTSSDGFSWTAQYSGINSDLVDVTYGDVGFCAVGVNGVILTSPDGINWSIQNSGTSFNLSSVSYGNGFYVAVGALFGVQGNITLTSLDGIVWTQRTTIAYEDYLFGTAFINNCFVLLGGNGAILESDNSSTMPLNLQIQPKQAGVGLIISAPSGSDFRLQACGDIAVPLWSDIASFTNVLAITEWSDSTTNSSRYYRAVSP